MKHEIQALQEALVLMNTILQDYIDRSKDMGVMGRVRFAVMDHNKLQSVQADLARSRTTFGLMLDLINMRAHEQHARNDRAAFEKLKDILDKQIREADARKAEAKVMEVVNAKVGEIHKMLEAGLPVATSNKSPSGQPSDLLDQLEKDLRRVGLSEEKARAARRNAAQALSGEHESARKPSLLTPKKDSREKRRSSDPTPRVERTSGRQLSGRPLSPSLSKAVNLPQTTKDYRILCVDSTHGSKLPLVLRQGYPI